MRALDHWHPVLRADELPRGAVAKVRLHGVELAVFHGASGRLGALPDVCIHRRMALSRGFVEGDRLVCPYHGWSYGVDGDARSPGTPPVKACAAHLEAVSRCGAIWVRNAGAATAFPRLDEDAFAYPSIMRHTVKAPVLVVLDNFTEVEHTATTHAMLGYPLDAMHRVEVVFDAAPDRVRVYNRGPQKPLPRALTALFGIGQRDDFVDDWTTFFSPLHTIYDQYWIDPDGQPRPDRLRIAVFFNPIDADTTELFTILGAHVRSWRRHLLRPLLSYVTQRIAEREIHLDIAMLNQLADKDPALRGMKLGRFDRPLREHRKRYEQLYLGNTAEAAPGEGALG